MHIDDVKEGIGTVFAAVAFVSAGVTGLVLLVAVLTGNTDKILEWGTGQIEGAVDAMVNSILVAVLRTVALAIWSVVISIGIIVAAFVGVFKAFQESLSF